MKRLAVLLLFCACTPPEYPPVPTDGAPCLRACERIRQLKCPEADIEAGEDGVWGSPDDVSCEMWMCAGTYLDHEKIANANTCDVLK